MHSFAVVFLCGNFRERTFSCLKCWQACTFCELWIFVTHRTSRKQIASSVAVFFSKPNFLRFWSGTLLWCKSKSLIKAFFQSLIGSDVKFSPQKSWLLIYDSTKTCLCFLKPVYPFFLLHTYPMLRNSLHLPACVPECHHPQVSQTMPDMPRCFSFWSNRGMAGKKAFHGKQKGSPSLIPSPLTSWLLCFNYSNEIYMGLYLTNSTESIFFWVSSHVRNSGSLVFFFCFDDNKKRLKDFWHFAQRWDDVQSMNPESWEGSTEDQMIKECTCRNVGKQKLCDLLSKVAQWFKFCAYSIYDSHFWNFVWEDFVI